MKVATKLGLAAWLEREAAESERFLIRSPTPHSPHTIDRLHAHIRYNRAAAYALRHMTVEQEVDFLEFQFGGPDGIGVDSYPNPITVLLPPPPKPPKRKWLDRFRDPHFAAWMPGDGP